MKTMKKVLALVLALTLLLAVTACGKKKGGDTTTATTTTVGDSADTTTTTDATTTTTTEGLLPEDERNGSKDLPFEIGGVLEFDAVVKAGGVTYYNVYRVNGTILTIKSKDATVEYEGKTYEPKNGVITFPVSTPDMLTPAVLAIGNRGKADATFRVTFSYPAGTKLNPIELKDGDLVTTLQKGDEDGLVYLYTATRSGTLTLIDNSVTKGVRYDISLFNLNTSAIRTLEEDGVDKGGKKTVSVEMNKGDKVEVTIAALPNDKNEYPAVTIKSTVSFKAGNTSDAPTEKWLDYIVTIKDQDGKPVAGVKMSISCEMIGDTAATDSKGSVTFNLPEGVPTGTIEVPKGYIAASKKFRFTAGSTVLTIVLEKEQVAPPAPPVDPDDPEVTTMDYTVTVLNDSAAPLGGVTVSFYSGDKQVVQKTADKKGVVKVTLDRGTYTLKIGGTALKYDEKAAVVSVNKPDLTLIAAPDYDTTKSVRINDPLIDKNIRVYYLPEGAVYVPLVAGERNYFVFEPTHDGTYRFAASNTYAKIGHFGTDMFVHTTSVAENVSGNAFTISVREAEVGNVYVIGIDAATNCSAAVVQITRIGDPAWDITDLPAEEYKGNGDPKSITAPSGLVDVDIKSSTKYELVYNAKDGYYHLNSSNGPVVYVRMNNTYLNFTDMFADTQTARKDMQAVIYHTDGSVSKEQYAPLMEKYVDKMDKTQKVYPLTKDLEYMIRNYGESNNLWNQGEPGYLFEEVEGINPDNAWLFLYCYKK